MVYMQLKCYTATSRLVISNNKCNTKTLIIYIRINPLKSYNEHTKQKWTKFKEEINILSTFKYYFGVSL